MELLRKTVWRVLKKLNMGLPYDLAILLLGIDPKELKTGTQILEHKMFTVASFPGAKRWKQPEPIGRGTVKPKVVQTHGRTALGREHEGISDTCCIVDEP